MWGSPLVSELCVIFKSAGLSAAPEGSLRTRLNVNAVRDNEPSDCDAQMNVIKQ